MHTIRIRADEDDIRQLAALAEKALPAVEAIHDWEARHGNDIGLDQDPLGRWFPSISILTDRVAELSEGTIPLPTLQFDQVAVDVQFWPEIAGTPRESALETTVCHLVSWLLGIMVDSHTPGCFPLIDDDRLRRFTSTVRDLKALCGDDGAEQPGILSAVRWVTASKADVIRFKAPKNTDRGNTKLVDRLKSDRVLDYRKAKYRVGKMTFEFLFTDPEEHARFERHMHVKQV